MRRLAVALLILAACARPDSEATLTVFAASSLTAAFQDIAAEFEEAHADVKVVLNLAGSQTLATQILEGAAADVFASADTYQMDRAVTAKEPISGPVTFATNQLVIAVERGNPVGIETLADLEDGNPTVVLGAEDVPVGRYTSRLLAGAGVEVEAASHETSVGLVLAKVALGEADAGIVYRSDLVGADAVEGVPIPDEVNVTARYPIAAWERDTGRPGLAADFVEFVLSEEGRTALRRAGLGP